MKAQKAQQQHERDVLTETTEESGHVFTVALIRGVIVLAAAACVYYYDQIQRWTNSAWYWLLQCSVFNSVYFESWLATFCYAVLIPIYPYALHYMKSLQKYKVHPSVTYEHQSIAGILRDAVIYLAPLMLLDTFIVKKYHAVDPEIWVEKRKSWIQTTRALPLEPPSFSVLVFDLIASVLLYDAMFFFLHFAFHKNFWLYKTFHAFHHDHDVMHAHVTNQLTVGERLALILSANFSLKVFNSHPVTRALFVPVFIWLLIDNHTGYDLPWGLHKIVPFGIMGGPRKHYAHHLEGKRHYQPFLTYLDKLLEMNKKSKLL